MHGITSAVHFGRFTELFIECETRRKKKNKKYAKTKQLSFARKTFSVQFRYHFLLCPKRSRQTNFGFSSETTHSNIYLNRRDHMLRAKSHFHRCLIDSCPSVSHRCKIGGQSVTHSRPLCITIFPTNILSINNHQN